VSCIERLIDQKMENSENSNIGTSLFYFSDSYSTHVNGATKQSDEENDDGT
jgi:hypothetical protein